MQDIYAPDEGDRLLPPQDWHESICALPGNKHPTGHAYQTSAYEEPQTGISFHLISMQENGLIEGMPIGIYLVVHMPPEEYRPYRNGAAVSLCKFVIDTIVEGRQTKPNVEASFSDVSHNEFLGNRGEEPTLLLNYTVRMVFTGRLWNNGPLFRCDPIRISEAQEIFGKSIIEGSAGYLPE